MGRKFTPHMLTYLWQTGKSLPYL